MWRWGGVHLSFGSFGCCVMLDERHSVYSRYRLFHHTAATLLFFDALSISLVLAAGLCPHSFMGSKARNSRCYIFIFLPFVCLSSAVVVVVASQYNFLKPITMAPCFTSHRCFCFVSLTLFRPGFPRISFSRFISRLHVISTMVAFNLPA